MRRPKTITNCRRRVRDAVAFYAERNVAADYAAISVELGLTKQSLRCMISDLLRFRHLFRIGPSNRSHLYSLTPPEPPVRMRSRMTEDSAQARPEFYVSIFIQRLPKERLMAGRA